MESNLQIKLTVKPDLNWDYEIIGNVALTPAALGALEMAKQNIVSNYFAKLKIPAVAEIPKPEYNEDKPVGEVRVSKDNALNTYIDHRTKIEKRISLIAKSDARQEFIINKTLLDNI